MSSHFNYEIDEPNLRARLKDSSLPYKEEAWVQFEAYSDLHRSNQRTGSLPSFHLNINRTLILPFVFGGVIILFSLLLFNFISIKNKNLTADIKNELISKKHEPEKEIVPVKEKSSETKELKIENAEIKKPAITPLPGTTALMPPVQTAITQIKTTPAATVEAIAPSGSWTSLKNGKIYTNPNIASDAVGNVNINQIYTALEETNYFIKISFMKDNKTETGFVRKDALHKNNGQSTAANFTAGNIARKKNRKAETLESIQTPVMLSAGPGEEKEPELK